MGYRPTTYCKVCEEPFDVYTPDAVCDSCQEVRHYSENDKRVANGLEPLSDDDDQGWD